MAQTEVQLEKLDEIATEISARFRKGEHPAIAEYIAQYPALAVELRALFPTIAAMERLKVQQEFRSGSRASLRGLQLTRLGDFRIIREIGRGGMGIVYEAEQESLGRRVAVKVLPRHVLLAPEHLQRFQREAQIAGRLHHTNIVSVFGVGEHDGFHYYVMPFIPGVALDRVIARLAESGAKAKAVPHARTKTDHDTAASGVEKLPELDDVVRHLFSESGMRLSNGSAGIPSPQRGEGAASAASDVRLAAPPREQTPVNGVLPAPGTYETTHLSKIARIGWQVANALEYAHQQGTLHCDIKPANLLVDPHGTVWVTDFGVAKAMQADKLTRTGDVTGTLMYTAPERFQGQTDARSDVYSLGLTLYELLALRPAFAEADRQALMRRILDGTPTPLRHLVPQIPRDLETIVLKAIARDPNHRYATAGALADDLQRYLEDRPILARRATYRERLTRWCRKNPAVASLLGTVACLLIAVGVLVVRGYINSRELQQAESAQRRKAEATTRVALDVLDRIYAQFAPHGAGGGTELALAGTDQTQVAIPVQPAISPETAAVLENLLAFYDRLAVDGGDNLELRQEAAKANRRIADIQAQLGQREKATAAYQRTLALYQQLANETPDKNHYVAEIAGIHNELGNLDRLTAKAADAKTAHREALKLLEPIANDANASPEARFELARTYYRLGTAHRSTNIPMGGELLGLPDRPREGGPPGSSPSDRPGRREPPGGRGPLGPPPEGGPRGFGPNGPRPGGPSEFGGPPPFGEGPPDDGLGPPDGGGGPPRPGGPGANRPPDTGEAKDEDAYLQKALAQLEPLSREFPQRADYRHLLACCYRDLARSPSPPAEAADGFNKAAEILEQLVKDYPHVPVYRFDLIVTQARLGPREERGAAAERELQQSLRRALQSAEDLVAEYPDVPAYAAFQVPMLHKLSGLLRRAGRPDESLAELNKALKIQTDLAARFPESPSHQLWLAIVQRSLAENYRVAGKLSEARTQLESAIKSLTVWPNESPPPQARELAGDTYHRLANLYRQLGETQLSADAARHAEEMAHRRRNEPLAALLNCRCNFSPR